MAHRILVVDDEPHVRRLLRQSMEHNGYLVEEASDGQQAIKSIDEHDYSLIIADIVMPERDGLEVIMHARRRQPASKIIAISSPGNQLYLTSAQGLGASRVFAKPFKLAEINEAAVELLAQLEHTSASS